MSERFKAKIGDDLYQQILDKGVKPSQFDFLDGYIPRERYNEISEKNKLNEAKLTDHEKQSIEIANLLKGNEEFKAKYDTLNNKYKQDLSAKDNEILNIYKNTKVREALKDSGAKHPDLLLSKVDFNTLTVDNDRLLGFESQLEKIKTDYKDLFVEVTKETNVNPGNHHTRANQNLDDINWEQRLNDLIK